MTAYKDPTTGKWLARFSYKTWDGKTIRTKKRGFSSKHEALDWERDYLADKAGSINMRFADFAAQYMEEIQPRIKQTTFCTKESIINKLIIPFFADKTLSEISTQDVMRWQNELLKWINPTSGKPFSRSYLKTIHNQLTAIMNHAVKYYSLHENPARIVGNMGDEKNTKMHIWTTEQYLAFSESMMTKPVSYYAFEVLYWCGLRLGEMLALTPKDVDLKAKTISVSKTYNRINGVDLITSPKTPKSNRTIIIPDFLADELSDYLNSIYGITQEDRMFDVSKSRIEKEMLRGTKEQNLPRIRVHDLRHSHVSMLINMGFSAVAIAERLGHESIDITYRYAHLFSDVQTDMAKKLNEVRGARNVRKNKRST